MSSSNNINLVNTEKSSSESESESSQTEYEEVDVTDHPLYAVLSGFFETDDGENLCDVVKELTDAVKENTKIMTKILSNSVSKKK